MFLTLFFMVALALAAYPYQARVRGNMTRGIDRSRQGPPTTGTIDYSSGGPNQFVFDFADEIVVSGPVPVLGGYPDGPFVGLSNEGVILEDITATGFTQVYPNPIPDGTYGVPPSPQTVRTKLDGPVRITNTQTVPPA